MHRRENMLLSLLIIREMHINLAQRNYWVDIRLPQIKTSANTKCGQECEEIDTIIRCLWECVFLHPF